MKEVFTFLLYREILTEDNKVVRRIPAVPKPYSSYSVMTLFLLLEMVLLMFIANTFLAAN